MTNFQRYQSFKTYTHTHIYRQACNVHTLNKFKRNIVILSLIYQIAYNDVIEKRVWKAIHSRIV